MKRHAMQTRLLDQADADFLLIATRCYRDDPYWLPESAAAVQAQLAQAQGVWLGVTEGARLAGFFDPQQQVAGEPTAFFGFWESLNDPAASAALFDDLSQWASAQGARRLIGPINVNTFNAYRIRLNAFDLGAFPGEPYNPPYYADLLTQLGFQEVRRFATLEGPLAGRARRLAPLVEPAKAALEAQGVRFTPLSGDWWMDNLVAIYRYVEQIFGENYAYRGISFDAFKAGYGAGLAARICPHSSVLALDDQGELAGFFLAIPDYSPLLRQGGRALPASQVSYAQVAELGDNSLLLGKTGGVHPRFRKQGLFAVMTYLMAAWGESRFTRGAAALVRDDNPSFKVAKQVFSLPDDRQRDYALFGRSLVAED